ncbi:MAG: alkaline phosphatase, partial [Actinomycetota bacterium]|nr:alkaline phosphatase [Actinomycetota bacterium]
MSKGNWYELDVTPLVTGDGPVAIRVSSPSPNGVDYVSTEGTPGLAPELIVELDEAPPSDTEDPSAPG